MQIRSLLKKHLKPLLIKNGIALNKNMQYDLQAWRIMKKILDKNSNCIDIGCHAGEFMDWMLELAPQGHHFGFEPIPELFNKLQGKFKKKVGLYALALGHETGKARFTLVRNAPAYSGLQKRVYSVKNPEIENIEVNVERLDNVFAALDQLKLLKIDVEGGEYDVIRGGKELILRCRPYIFFEFGKGAAEYYGSGPDAMFDLLDELNMNVYQLNQFLMDGKPLLKSEFIQHFEAGTEYYFIAGSK
jgi:FkbM family methyltransferase